MAACLECMRISDACARLYSCPHAIVLLPRSPACPCLLVCRVIVNKPLGTDLQHLYARLDQLQGGGGGGAAAGGALGGLGAGGASALFGQGGPAAPGAGGVLPAGGGEHAEMAAAAAAAAGAGGAEDDDIPAESLQQVGARREWALWALWRCSGGWRGTASRVQQPDQALSGAVPVVGQHPRCWLAPCIPADGGPAGVARPAGPGSPRGGRPAAAAGAPAFGCEPSTQIGLRWRRRCRKLVLAWPGPVNVRNALHDMLFCAEIVPNSPVSTPPCSRPSLMSMATGWSRPASSRLTRTRTPRPGR